MSRVYERLQSRLPAVTSWVVFTKRNGWFFTTEGGCYDLRGVQFILGVDWLVGFLDEQFASQCGEHIAAFAATNHLEPLA